MLIVCLAQCIKQVGTWTQGGALPVQCTKHVRTRCHGGCLSMQCTKHHLDSQGHLLVQAMALMAGLSAVASLDSRSHCLLSVLGEIT